MLMIALTLLEYLFYTWNYGGKKKISIISSLTELELSRCTIRIKTFPHRLSTVIAAKDASAQVLRIDVADFLSCFILQILVKKSNYIVCIFMDKNSKGWVTSHVGLSAACGLFPTSFPTLNMFSTLSTVFFFPLQMEKSKKNNWKKNNNKHLKRQRLITGFEFSTVICYGCSVSTKTILSLAVMVIFFYIVLL